ncbi:MAG TPA: calcium/proton exchanger [Phycisphaerae bacterium]|nr:calcium/proton exchanger [Phycisphaerae bacterium]
MKYFMRAGWAAIPVAFLIHFWIGHGESWEPLVTFLLAGFGVLPLAHMMGESTEHLASRTGPTWGGLLNATFGNAAELIIAIIAMTKGLNEVVKASLTGSIIGNLLLVGGLAMVVGGWKRVKQTFSAGAAEANGGLLAVGVAAMLMPAIFHFTAQSAGDPHLIAHEHSISIGASAVLLAVYALGLLFTLKTHKHIFSAPPQEEQPAAVRVQHEAHPVWSVKRSVTILLLAAAGVGIVAELLVGSAEAVATELGWNHVFVGVIVLAIIGNAAEHSTAIVMARRNDMDTAMTITYQSSLQIALFVTPALVLLSAAFYATGLSPREAGMLNMVFTPMEVTSVILCVAIVVILGVNGETNWFEGVLLLALYVILGVGFYFLPGENAETPRHGGQVQGQNAETAAVAILAWM